MDINYFKLLNWSEVTRMIKGIASNKPAKDFQKETRETKIEFEKRDGYLMQSLEQTFAPICPKIRYFELLEAETNAILRDQFNIEEFQAIAKVAAAVNIDSFSYHYYLQQFNTKLNSPGTIKKIKALSFAELFFLVRVAEGGVLVF